MKKITVGIVLLIALFFISIYVFIPSKIQVQSVNVVKCISKNVSSCVNDSAVWRKWWPVQSRQSFAYNNFYYQLANPLTDGADIVIRKQDQAYQSRIQTIPFGKDSTVIHWTIDFTTSNNPFKRLQQRNEAVVLRKNTDILLEHLKEFAAKTENIYGFHIERTTFPDTLLASTKFSTNHYPTVDEIYNAINKIKTTIAKQGIKETGSPMLNIMRTDSSLYQTMVAVPTDKAISNDDNVSMSRMLTMKDRFLFTEVVGGPTKIQKAHEAINQYMLDHFLSAPAIPFEILTTDRSKEQDTSKWKTLVYYPSM